MAINVDFYNFNKRINSTKIPSEIGETFSCTIKDDCSILTPTIRLTGASIAFKPVNYNYARIADFGRYYFVTDWKFSGGCWYALMQADELASFRSEIGQSTQYISRTSGEHFNPYLIDTNYKSTATLSSVIVEPSAYTFVDKLENGCVVVGIISPNAGYLSPVANFIFTIEQFRNFWDLLFSNDSDVSIAQPLQYIVYCHWLPFSVLSFYDLLPVNTIHMGAIDHINCECYLPKWTDKNVIHTSFFTFSCDKHPQATERGFYMNCTPFTRRTIQWSVLGEIPLDTNIVANANNIKVAFDIDITTGSSTYRILVDDWKLLTSGECTIGVSLPVSQDTYNFMNVFKGSFNGLVSMSSGNITGGVNAVADIASNLMPQLQKTGSSGNLATYLTGKPIMRTDFISIVEEDNGRFGRPLYQVSKISNVGTFVQCENADFNATGATKSEIESINNFMNGGFYYE